MKGDVVVVEFPFSDHSGRKKRRPALVLIECTGEDLVLAAITATNAGPYSLKLEPSDFVTGNLDRTSFVRLATLFTLRKDLLIKQIGSLKEEKRKQIADEIYNLMS